LAYKTGNTAFGDKIAKMLATPTFDNINNEINKSENAPTLRFLQKSLMESPLPIANIIKY
jgi:hypothetical protein